MPFGFALEIEWRDDIGTIGEVCKVRVSNAEEEWEWWNGRRGAVSTRKKKSWK